MVEEDLSKELGLKEETVTGIKALQDGGCFIYGEIMTPEVRKIELEEKVYWTRERLIQRIIDLERRMAEIAYLANNIL